MKISIGSDHGGYALKQELIAYLQEKGHEVKDFGCHDTSSCDYPHFGAAAPPPAGGRSPFRQGSAGFRAGGGRANPGSSPATNCNQAAQAARG